MKARLKVFALVAMIALTGIGPVAITGCVTTPKKLTYQTLASVGALADNGMKAAAQGKKHGKVSDAQWKQIADKHAKYKATYDLACDLAGFDKSTFASVDVTTSLQDLLAVITSFGVTIQ